MKHRPAWNHVACGAFAFALAGVLLRDLGLFDAVSAWLPAAFLGALVGLGGGQRTRPLAVAAGAVFAAWLAVAFTPLAAWLSEGLTRRDALPAAADAVLVLGSRLQADGEPTPTAESRLLHALELLREGRSGRLVVTEAPPPAASHARFARALVARLGLEVEVVAVGPTRSTREEAVALGALARERGFRRVILATSPLHSLRSALAIERVGLVVASSPATETNYDLETLDRPAERLLAFADAMHERLGLAYYAWRGWLPSPQGTP